MTLTLNEALLAYLDHLIERGLSRSHRQSVTGRVGRFTQTHGNIPLTDITPAHIADHFKQLEDAGLADGTLAGHKSSFRAFWRWLQDRGHITTNPTAVLKQKTFSYSFDPVNHRAADEDAFRAVLSAIPSFIAARDYAPRDVRDALAVSFAADSAARRGEIWSIRRANLEKALRKPTPLPGGHVYHLSSRGKTGQSNIRFFDNTADLARMWLNTLPATATFVFASTKTWERLPRDYMNSAFQRVCQFAGVEEFQWQSVRKRVVSDMISLTGNVTAGQMLAGHASVKTTLRYYNEVQQATVDQAASQLARLRNDDAPKADGLAEGFFARLQPPKS